MRCLDHMVLVAGNLSEARKYYRRMGFKVAPDGVHPFGTYNANMYFRGGSMIETLGIKNQHCYQRAIEEGNTFVRNDAAFRANRGDWGFSHIVMTSTDATEDHMNFKRHGVSGGDIVSFSRQFEQPDGKKETVSAKLAFATHQKARFGFYFTCEDIIVPDVDHSKLLDHENGAVGVNYVISCSAEPVAYVDFLKTLIGSNKICVNDQIVDCDFPNGHAVIMTPGLLAEQFGIKHGAFDKALFHSGLVFAVENLQKTEVLFKRNRIPFLVHKGRLVCQSRFNPGQFFAFEQLGVAQIGS